MIYELGLCEERNTYYIYTYTSHTYASHIYAGHLLEL